MRVSMTTLEYQEVAKMVAIQQIVKTGINKIFFCIGPDTGYPTVIKPFAI